MIAPRPMLPPRPNLGPEPWPSASSWPWQVFAATVVVLVLIARGLALFRRRRPTTAASLLPSSSSPDPSPSRDRVREALAHAFGPSWRARTTEEVAGSSALPERFGDEVSARVVAYLRAADRSKFSADPAPPDKELAWWAERFAEEVGADERSDIMKVKEQDKN